MRKEVFVIFLVSLLLLVSGQEGCQSETTGKTDPFVGGKEGILIDFVEGAPPPEVFDQGHQFEIVVRLQNKGEHDVKSGEGKVEISGISKQDFEGKYSKSLPDGLSGTYKNPEGDAVEGGITYLTFENFEHQNPLEGNTMFTVRAEICYKYETKAVTSLCVRKNILEYGEEDAVCEIAEEKQVYNSGSPIQITSFKQNVGGTNKLSFTFKIAHQGIGAIYSPGTLCDTSKLINRNKVKVTVETGMLKTECYQLGGYEGDVTLYDGTASITCTQEIPTGEGAKAYEKPVTIKVLFDYKEHIDAPLLVKHLR